MKLNSLFRLSVLLLAIGASVIHGQTTNQGQWNTNSPVIPNDWSWFNGTNWLQSSAPNGVGQTAIINQDFNPGRMIGDFFQTQTMTTSGSQQVVQLTKTPTTGSIGVTDGTLFWSQSRGTTSTAWTVTYDSGTNQVRVTYSPALTGTRTLTVTYGTAAATTFNDVVGVAEQVGQTNGTTTTFTRVLRQIPDTSALGVTDGVYYWSSATQTSSSPSIFSVSYNAGTRSITVTYDSAANAPSGRPIVAAYIPSGTPGAYGVAVNTEASQAAVVFTSTLKAQPVTDTNFVIASGGLSWINGSPSNSSAFDASYTSPTTVVLTFKNGTAMSNLAGGTDGVRLVTASYTTLSATAKNVTLGGLFIGDMVNAERVDLRLNSLTFDNNGQQSQLNKIIGGPDEIAGNITLNNTLALAVRTGGDVASKNSLLISSNISGVGGLTKLDSGNVALSGNNTYTGATSIRNTGGTVFLNSTTGNAINSQDVFLGNASRDGHSSVFLQLSRANQIADTSTLWFDAASGRNSFFKLAGFNETLARISDYTGQGVIENTQDEADFSTNSVLTLNSNSNASFNGIFRNKNSAPSSGTIGLTKTGTGTQILSGNNIFYTGVTTVSGGTLSLQNMVGQGNMPYNPQSQTDGTTATGGAFDSRLIPRFRSNITNNATVDLGATTTDWTFGNVISGNGAVTKTGLFSLNVTNANTYSGATTISGGSMILRSGVSSLEANAFSDYNTAADYNGNLAGAQRQKAIYGSGSLLNTSAINLVSGGLSIVNAETRKMLVPDSSSTETTLTYNSTNRVNDAAPINVQGGFINFTHSHDADRPAISYSETLGALNVLSGETSVFASQAESGQTSKLTFASLSRSAGGALYFQGREIGDNTRNQVQFTTKPTLVNGIIGGWATMATVTTINAGQTNENTNYFYYDFATTDASGIVKKYTGYKESWNGTSAVTVSTEATWGATDNVRIFGNNPTMTSLNGATNSPRRINSLKFDGTASRTLTLRSGGINRTLVIETGGLLNAADTSGAMIINNGSLTAGNAGNTSYELLPWVANGRYLQINSTIVDNPNGTTVTSDDLPVRVVKSGPGILQLFGNNTYKGGTTINQGVVEISLISSLGAAPVLSKADFLTFNGGTLEGPNSNTNIIFEPQMGITLGQAGGIFALKTPLTVTINSNITGPGGLQVGGGGIGADSTGGLMVINGNNTFQGGITIVSGILRITGGTNTFAGPVTINSGNRLSISSGAAWPSTKPAIVSNGEFDVGGNITVGQLSGTGTISSDSATSAVTLVVDQESNSTFSGTIASSVNVLSLEKRGKGTLTLNSSSDSILVSTFNGAVKISEGVLAANLLSSRGAASSIGYGDFDSTDLDSFPFLESNEKSAANLVISNGAALSFVGGSAQTSNRPFTIGVGELGASVLANGVNNGSPISFVQAPLRQIDDFSAIPGQYDTIEFSATNQKAMLNLGGRNQGLNRFGMDLHNNGTGVVSLTKTGDGQWILGALDENTGLLETTASRSDFTGRTTIYLGTLGIEQNGVLGAAGGESVNLVGGNLDLRNVDYAVNEGLSMAGGRLRALIGNSAWTGGVSLDVSSTIEVGANASLRMRGAISGKGSLTKVGFGTLILENQNSFTGSAVAQEGTLRLDYSTNTGSKLPDGSAFTLGGGRNGATLDITGGNGASIVEIVANMNIGLGFNQITRSDAAATNTIVRLNNLEDRRVAQGAALDFGESNIAQTDRLNNAAGILGSWMTVGKSSWATSASSGIDIPITALATYTNNTWGGATTNTTVTASNTVAADSTTYTLRFNQAGSSVVTLQGNTLLKSGGILQTPASGTGSNVITGGSITLENNINGGSLMVHQHGTASALTINSVIANSAAPADLVGVMYIDSSASRFRFSSSNTTTSATEVINRGLYAGMAITGTNLEPGTTISSIDYTNGNINFSQGRTADVGVTITITPPPAGPSYTLTGDTMVAGVVNRVRVFGSAAQLNGINVGDDISGGVTGVIPATAVITGKTLDNPDAPTSALLTINLNIPVPAQTAMTLSFQSRNGVTKFGNGRLTLGGANTYTGPVIINGGVLSVTQLANGGTASPLGASTSLATNIQISSSSLEYVGNSVTTDRGFQINEVGSVDIARTGSVATFTGNLSGGVGAALGVLEKAGEGTLKISRILGNIASPLSSPTQPTYTPATVGTGGATNFGGLTVKAGKLQLAYENPNSNDNTDRFAASTASLTMAGGTLELVGLANANWPSDTAQIPASSPSENRVQQLLGQLTLTSGSSEIIVTGGKDTTTTLRLQDPNNPVEVLRQPGSTVHFFENPNGGTAAITLAIPAFFQGTPLTWATYRDGSNSSVPGVNDFAAVEQLDDGIVSADAKRLYTPQADVSQWVTNQSISESSLPFSGTTADYNTSVYLLRFFNKAAGVVNVSANLSLSGGAILLATNIGDVQKRIQGGTLTSNMYSLDSTSDLMIHNYNPAREFEIASTIVNGLKPVNLVHTGDGTTRLFSANTYTGSTYLNGGVLRLSTAQALPGGVGSTGGTSNLVLQGGVLGLETDFNRPLGTTIDAVQFTGSGGFAAYSGTSTVNFGGAGAQVQWAQGNFVPRGSSLMLSSYDSDGTVRVTNPINLGATFRQVDVADGSAAVDAELNGVLSGVGAALGKLGQGTLRLTAANTFTGGTTLAQGTLLLSGAGLGDVNVGTVDGSAVSDALTLQFDTGSTVAKVTVGNFNSQGISTIKVTGNSTVTNGVDLQRDVFVDAAPGRTLNINGASTGTGRIRVNDGGSVSFNGTGTFAPAIGGSQGTAIDGGVIVRNGNVMIGADAGLGSLNIELGDSSTTFSVATVDRTSAGRSVLQHGGSYYEKSSGLIDDSDGTGAFIYENQSTLTIDGKVYGKADAFVINVPSSVGKRILINGETEHPERNGLYELYYDTGDTTATTDDSIALRRVTAFDDQREHNYGARITVQNGTDAGKNFFLATIQPDTLPAEDINGRILVTTPVYWKQDASLNPNVGLLAAAAGLTIPNTVDINNTNGTGATTLGGAVNFISGTSTFTGNVVFQGQVAGAESKTVRLTSESLTGQGAVFSGVISEASPSDSLALVKVGAGIVTLRGDNNTYKGGTQVNSGTLLVTNDSGSATGTGAVVVSNFGTALGGSGIISGATSLLSGASLLPGDPLTGGIGEPLTFGSSLSFGADTSLWLQWVSELQADKLNVDGLLSMDPTALIKISLEFVPTGVMSYDFINWGSISATGGLADRLDLPALASSTLYWDTAAFSTTGTLAIAVRDTNGPPPVHFSIREASAAENVGTVRIAVELDWEPTTQVTVPIVTSGTATVGATADYTLSESTLTFNATERSKELVITVRDDPSSELTEKIVLTIGTPTGAVKGSPTTFTLTVIDNDSGLPLADRWVLRNPQPTNETLSGVTAIGTTLVAVGTKGSIFKSTDVGVTWTKQPLPVGLALNAIANDGTTFVAVGDNGNVVTSPDGSTWTVRSVGGGKTLLDVVRTSSRFVAVGVDGVAYHSADGFAWTFVSTGLSTEDLRAVTASTSLLVAVGEAGVVVTSSDNGDTWAVQTSNTSSDLNGVTNNGTTQYVAVGAAGALVTSSNGTSWTVGSSGTSANLNAVRRDASIYVAVGAGGTIRTSPNGASWAARTSGVTDDLEEVGKVGSNWLALGQAGIILTSGNSTSWARVTNSTGVTNLLADVAAAGTQLVAVGAGSEILTSSDGATWTRRTPAVPVTNKTFYGVAGSASAIIAVGQDGAAVASTTGGSSWGNVSTGVQNLHDIVLSGSAFYAVGDAGTALKTIDAGATWETLNSNTVDNLRGIATNGTVIVAVGANGAVVTSTDAGASWTLVDTGSTAALEDITWTGTTFIAVGGGSTIFTTPDGVVWTKRAAPQLATLTSVAGLVTRDTNNAIIADQAIATGLDGVAFLSNDGGATWVKRDTGTSRSIEGLAVNSVGRFAAVGQSGTILTTEQVLPPPPSIFFTVASQTVNEDAGVVNIEVNASPTPNSTITVPFVFNTPAGNAVAGSTNDYTSAASPLVFTAGQSTKTIAITVKNDNKVESTETVIITLVEPTGTPTLASPSQFTLTITDNDIAPSITNAPDHAIVELGASHTFNADAAGSGPLSLQWQKATANIAGALMVSNVNPSAASYTIPSVTIANGGTYRLKAYNPVVPAGALSAFADLVVVDTSDKLVLAKPNTTATLTANVGGPATAYRWFKDNVEITADVPNELTGFDKKTLLVKTLTQGEEGDYKCRVSGQGGILFTGIYDVNVGQTPVITNTISALPSGAIGKPYAPYDVFAAAFEQDIHNRPTKWTMTGGPLGLSISAAGVISGIPQDSLTVDKPYTVKISASNITGTTVSFTASLFITKLTANAIGSFVGLVDRSGTFAGGTGTLDLGARFDLTTTANAKFTGSLIIGTTKLTKHSVTGILDTSGANPVATVTIPRTGGKSTLTLFFTIDTAANLVTGTVSDLTPTTAALNGWRNVWKKTSPDQASAYVGRHNVMAAIPSTLEGDTAHPNIPQGDSYFSIVVDIAGKATVSGKAADGSVIATSAQIGPNGEVLVYQALYATTAMGSFIGRLDIDTATSAHKITAVAASWNKPAQAATVANLYRNGFGQTIDLDIAGGLYTATPATYIIMHADPAQSPNAGMTFFDASGLTASPTATNDPNLPQFRINPVATFVKPIPNPNAHALTFVNSTGLFSGSFTLTDTLSKARTVKYYGMVVPDADTGDAIDGIGAGYFVLSPYTTTPTAAQKSGRVTIIPVLEP